MKKLKLLTYIFGLCLATITLVVSLFAWFSSTKDSVEIDGNSSGVKYVYSINGNEKNVKEFNVTNLCCFDITNPTEASYFKNMACKVTFEIINVGDVEFTYRIYKSLSVDEAGIYVDAYLTTEDLADLSISSIENILTNNEINSDSSVLLKGETITVYAYFILVAPSSAKDEEIYNGESRDFSLIIETSSR